MKILLPVDGSPFTQHMLAYVAAHCDVWAAAQPTYTVLHVVPAVPPRAAAMLDPAVLHDYYEEETDKVFHPVRRFFEQHPLAVTFVHRVGHAAQEIARCAQEGPFDLLIMGSHGHGALGNWVMGSVATQVMARCTTPVLLVR